MLNKQVLYYTYIYILYMYIDNIYIYIYTVYVYRQYKHCATSKMWF